MELKMITQKISTDELISFYLKRAKMAGIGKHSIIPYAVYGINNRDDFIEVMNQIQQKHGDCMIVSLASTSKDKMYIIVLPKSGIIGVKTAEYSTSNKYIKDSSHYKRSLGAGKLMDRMYRFGHQASSPKGVNAAEIFASSGGKLYDILKSKLMLERSDDKDYATRQLVANILFGIERIGVTSKWTLDGYVAEEN